MTYVDMVSKPSVTGRICVRLEFRTEGDKPEQRHHVMAGWMAICAGCFLF